MTNASLHAPDPIGRALLRLSTLVAILGGLSLLFVIAVIVYAIVAREVAGLGLEFVPVLTGDFELVELGAAVAIFAFLPYCQMVRGNVAVDFFTQRASDRTKAVLDLLGNAIFAAIAVTLLLQTHQGLLDKMRYMESTMVLRIPVWWGYVPAVAFLALLVAVTFYTCVRAVREFRDAGRAATEGRS